MHFENKKKELIYNFVVLSYCKSTCASRNLLGVSLACGDGCFWYGVLGYPAQGSVRPSVSGPSFSSSLRRIFGEIQAPL